MYRTADSTNPRSPQYLNPDTALIFRGNFSSDSGSNSPTYYRMESDSFQANSPSSQALPYPSNHPLGGSKYLCAICEDKSSGKHYGVYSCEGCKGFFKRTVRKELTYACRENRNCTVDKRHRNRCQFCRYHKCLNVGMKREAVQEERLRKRGTKTNEIKIPAESILQAEKRIENKCDDQNLYKMTSISEAMNFQINHLIQWAKHIPHFSTLPIGDQISLLREGWNELLIAGFSHNSIQTKNGIVLGVGVTVDQNTAHEAGLGAIFDRVITEVISKMRDMNIDKTELGCLRSIILFNPEVRGLISNQEVELLREKVYATLEEYTRVERPKEPGRFAKLLLRLPTLRSVGLKCLEYLFFIQTVGNLSIDNFLMDMLDTTCYLQRL